MSGLAIRQQMRMKAGRLPGWTTMRPQLLESRLWSSKHFGLSPPSFRWEVQEDPHIRSDVRHYRQQQIPADHVEPAHRKASAVDALPRHPDRSAVSRTRGKSIPR